MTEIAYPRNRPREFKILGLSVLYFIAGFFWIPYLVVHEIPRAYDWVGPLIFVANITLLASFMIRRAMQFRDATGKDIQRVTRYPRVTDKELEWIKARDLDVTVHAVESHWEQGQAKRPGPRLHVEFKTADNWLLFRLACR